MKESKTPRKRGWFKDDKRPYIICRRTGIEIEFRGRVIEFDVDGDIISERGKPISLSSLK